MRREFAHRFPIIVGLEVSTSRTVLPGGRRESGSQRPLSAQPNGSRDKLGIACDPGGVSDTFSVGPLDTVGTLRLSVVARLFAFA